MNKTTEKWKQTGLLENLENDIQCDELALALENMAATLLQYSPTPTPESQEFASMLLPIVRRVYENIKPLPSAEWLYNDFKQFCTDNAQLKQELKDSAVYFIDAEAEWVTIYTDVVVEQLRILNCNDQHDTPGYR
jgi:hypothetical protein